MTLIQRNLQKTHFHEIRLREYSLFGFVEQLEE